MRLRGSILIVVLGLLAVLAVVGVAFVTMSSIESNTSANFALQAQFDLAADGAVDYVCQDLIRDIWEFGTNPTVTSDYRTYSGWALTGKYGTAHYDWPSLTLSADPTIPTPDAFLATSWSSGDPAVVPANVAYSYRAIAPTIKPYLLDTWGGGATGNTAYIGTGIPGSATGDGSPNNLGIPGTNKSVKWYTPQNGLWIPELAFPYENGIIRVSVTVQDHAAMVNLNAHGTPLSSGTSWSPYGQAAGKGYFTCDVTPAGVSWLSGFTNITDLLDGTRTPAPGRYGTARTPGNKRLGEIFIQNPTIIATGTSGSKDRPFTLDDEFELRRLSGTYAKSRLEQIIGTSLDSTPNTTATKMVTARMGLTTVGWNAEVMPANQGTCVPKCDINLTGDTGLSFVSILGTGGVFDTTATAPAGNVDIANQFAANVRAFKDRGRTSGSTGNYFKQYGGSKWGARRQVFLSKVQASVQRAVPTATQDTWKVRVQVYNPWDGSYAGDPDTGGINVEGHQIKIYFSGSTTQTISFPATNRVANRQTWEEPDSTKRTFVLAANKTLEFVKLEATGPGVIDQITGAELGSIGATSTTKYRPFGVYDEPRGADDTDTKSVVTVLYVKKWAAGADSWNLTPEGGTTAVGKGNGIPIRFPHSVPMDDAAGKAVWDTKVNGPLPPYYTANDAAAKSGVFKAFLRVGDLNQVLCPATQAEANAYWPWVTRVADKSGVNAATAPTITEETSVKWDWWKTGTDQTAYTLPLYDRTVTPAVRQYRRYNGANVFCVDSPWADFYDNDGDGKTDNLDLANSTTTDTGRFCGQEVRVAGRININTATDQALRALGWGLTNNENTYTAIATKRPFRSAAEVLDPTKGITATPPADFAGGPLEKRDYPYTLISNIATVRSDTFSIYGTVQFLYPPSYTEATATKSLGKIKIVRTRRFWALIDRSPVLNAPPTSTASFIRPRVLNFQWLD